jgi:hypothetical protein
MRTIIYKTMVWLSLTIGLLFTACSDDDGYSLGEFVLELATVQGTQSDFTLITDAGKVLFPSVNADWQYEIENGGRIWVNYTILGDGNRSNIDHFVRINDMNQVLTKQIIELTPQNSDSIGNDGLIVDEAWISNHYLNVKFRYEGSPWTVHYINLVKDIKEPTIVDGTPLFKLMHNKNGDIYTHPLMHGFVSIDLRPLQNSESGSFQFMVSSKGIDTTTDFAKTATYRW